MTAAERILQEWQEQLAADLSTESEDIRQGILHWLIGQNPERFNEADQREQSILAQALRYRYQILRQRYWAVSPTEGHRRLVKRLSSLFLVRSKIRTWIALSRDRRRTVVDVLQEVLQEMLQSDRHLRHQIAWIGQCTQRPRLRNLLMLATLEEYCMRPIRNQPLLVYRFVNYLRRSQRGGMTQVPTGELVKLISDEITLDNPDNSLSLLDVEAASQFDIAQQAADEEVLREQVKQRFLDYLKENLDATAAQWLELHLRGDSQDVIAQKLQLSVKEAYRLREKIRYHAIRVFTLKEQPDLVLSWLRTSLKEHNLGLTPEQWERFWQARSPLQQSIIKQLKAGESLEAIARQQNLKLRQAMAEWAQIYIEAQALRSQDTDPQ